VPMPARNRRLLLPALLAAGSLAGATSVPDPALVWQRLVLDGIRAATLGNLSNAEDLLSKAVGAAGKFPPGDARTGSTLNTLGLVYKDEKKYGDAGKTFAKALAIMEKAYGADSLDVGNVDFNIASVLMADGHYGDAVPYIGKSRNIYQKILGPESLKAAATLCMVGAAYRNLKKFNEAEAPLKQCAEAREAGSGVASPEFADALFNLALLYRSQGKYALVETRLRMAEKIREIAFGVASPEFAEALEAHAELLKLMGRDADATRDEIMAAAIRHAGKKAQ